VSAIGWFVSYAVFLVVGVVLHGWTLTVLWAWFVVPTFRMAALGIAPALGLSMLIGYLTRQDINIEAPERTNGERLGRFIALALVAPALTLGMAWVVHLFMGGAA
jgi:hypothetical protein